VQLNKNMSYRGRTRVEFVTFRVLRVLRVKAFAIATGRRRASRPAPRRDCFGVGVIPWIASGAARPRNDCDYYYSHGSRRAGVAPCASRSSARITPITLTTRPRSRTRSTARSSASSRRGVCGWNELNNPVCQGLLMTRTSSWTVQEWFPAKSRAVALSV